MVARDRSNVSGSHPNAAKLFIKFALSQDGFDPWNKMGTYPATEGLTAAEGMPPREGAEAVDHAMCRQS